MDEERAQGNSLNCVVAKDDNFSANTAQNREAVREISRLILGIIFEYALNKFDQAKVQCEEVANNFLPIIDRFVAAGTRVEACLPAFPFKSANKVYKVLGSLPDKAEELALDRLNSMCARIRQVYSPGAQVTIISDGITYNGTLTVSAFDPSRLGSVRSMD
jgi:pyoverdine/dityrosine biosynthesis protein Dit1